MSQLIRIRRGTKIELMNYGALQSGELGFCTDTKEVFVGDGLTNNLVGAAMMGTLASRPSAGTKGRFYYVTTAPNAGDLYIDDGSAWQLVNPRTLASLAGTLDDIADGVNYKKVVAADVSSGHVNKVSDGTNSATAAQIRTHIDDVTIHRKINDAAVTSTDLWSSQRIKTEIFNSIKGMDWQDSVKSRTVATPPATPASGDRYIVAASATGAWLNKTGQIAEWNGSAWVFYPAATGWAAYIEDENKNYTYNNAGQWVPTGGANQNVIAGDGLTGGGSSDTVTIDVVAGNGIELANDAVNVKAANGITSTTSGVGVKAYNGINVDANGVSVKSYNGITVDANGVAANIDNSSIKYDAANGNRLVVAVIDGGTF